jgi:hypothetical protein
MLNLFFVPCVKELRIKSISYVTSIIFSSYPDFFEERKKLESGRRLGKEQKSAPIFCVKCGSIVKVCIFVTEHFYQILYVPSIPFRQIRGTIFCRQEEKPVVSDLETPLHSRKCLTASQKGRRIISSFCSNTGTHPYHFIQG